VNRFRAALAHPLGVAIGDMLPPERIPETARGAQELRARAGVGIRLTARIGGCVWLEGLGYSHLTIPEDCFYLPAQVGVTFALGATERIPNAVAGDLYRARTSVASAAAERRMATDAILCANHAVSRRRKPVRGRH
jgi:hypothetical protein